MCLLVVCIHLHNRGRFAICQLLTHSRYSTLKLNLVDDNKQMAAYLTPCLQPPAKFDWQKKPTPADCDTKTSRVSIGVICVFEAQINQRSNCFVVSTNCKLQLLNLNQKSLQIFGVEFFFF